MKSLSESGIDTGSIFIEDGSGLSPKNAITSKGMAELLSVMKKDPQNFSCFYNSLPEAGKAGTLKNSFKDSVFESNLRAKSGSMTRVRSYAGFFKTRSGKEMAFCIIVNNFSGSHQKIIRGIEGILRETIITN
jgi:D-alanyl-D-alanine carboxypeptidase/D-alanyl-D-alanine-endopeptidase (penicillin-binding protein 4)